MNVIEKMKIVQHPERPNAANYIHSIFTDFVELHGDRLVGDDSSIIGGVGYLTNIPITIIGQVRGRNLEENLKYNFSMSHPEGFRKSLRLMKQAEKFKRIVICFVDTLGAYPGIEAEERGQSAAIANNLMEMMSIKIPIISVLIGNGGSGGALALTVANEVIMLDNALFSIISPKGCAQILWKDSSRQDEAAERLKMTSEDLYQAGLVDTIIKEPSGGAHEDFAYTSEKIKMQLEKSVKKYQRINGTKAQKMRYKKFREIGKVLI